MMSAQAQDILAQLLDDAGFSQNGQRVLGLLDQTRAAASVTTALRYRRLLSDNIDEETGSTIDLVYEVPGYQPGLPGSPAIYFKALNRPTPDLIVELRRRVWNQGRAPTLWIVTPDVVRIYNGFARPKDGESDNTHLLAELTYIGGQFQQIAAFHRREFDTGAFWTSKYGRKIDRSQRVDQAMLADLTRTEQLLTSGMDKADLLALSSTVGHALLGRAIFVRYLIDRNILSNSFFYTSYGHRTFEELLLDRTAVYSFFNWLATTFNGDLFPITPEEEATVQLPHLHLISAFLSGTDLSNYPLGQTRLWPYNFDVIPVDLISSIYEMFAHSHDPQAAEALSIHYTRLPLVELVLSLAMQDIDHTARVLDPACGSGVFLVEAFRRLAWLRSKQSGHELSREELHKLLREQIFGIDIDPGAVQVAAFSLYLTLLELDPDPRPPSALKFPPLQRHDAATEQEPNLYVQDFCNSVHAFNQAEPFVSKGFDLIIGNPPWTALTSATAPRDSVTGHQWSFEYCKQHHVPDSKPDLAFMERSRDFANAHTQIAFVVCSRLLYQEANINQGERWIDRFLQICSVDVVINLSDFVNENILFGGHSSTRLPATVMFFRAVSPEDNHDVVYMAPKWHPAIKRQTEICITSADVQRISQSALTTWPFLWKSAFRGSSRDFRLLVKLHEYPTLDTVLTSVGISGPSWRNYGITFGSNPTKDASALMGTPFLPSGITGRYGINVDELPVFDRQKIAAKSNSRKLELPALILFRSIQDYRGRTALLQASANRTRLVFDHMYYGISFAQAPWLGYRINAVLNSKLAFYTLFMYSSAIGWDRKLVEPVDWFQARLPVSILAPEENEPWQVVLREERRLREYWQSAADARLNEKAIAAQEALDQAVYRLYGLSEQEITLVEDTVRFNIDGFLRRNETAKRSMPLDAFAPPSDESLRAYAIRMCKQLNGILRYGNLELVPTIAQFTQPSPLRACLFTQRQKKKRTGNLVRLQHLEQVDDIISQMSQDLRAQLADNLYVQRDLRVYGSESFWIIKSAEKRLWSESAALHDADIVLCEHMETQLNG